jgi:hypothetical protein
LESALIEEDPYLVENIEQEREIISQLYCQCGGKYAKKEQTLLEVDLEDGKSYIDQILLKCSQCNLERVITFDVTDMLRKEEDSSSGEPGKEISAAQNAEAGDPYIPDDKRVESPDEETIKNAPFCSPYQRLLDIYSTMREKRIQKDEALGFIREGKQYIEQQMEKFETEDRIKDLNPALAQANNTVKHGLSLILTGYEKLEERLIGAAGDEKPQFSNEKMKKAGAAFLTNERQWEEVARDGNDFVNQGKIQILNMEAVKGA